VSNRLPVTVRREEGKLTVHLSTGGLATGLNGPHRESQGLWLGWPGDDTELSDAEREGLTADLASQRLCPVFLTPDEVHRYYEGFSNRVLWPLFHSQLDHIPLGDSEWDVYRRVNEKFADEVCARYREGDTLWLHDYQLMLLPTLVRKRLPRARIGFFLHIPFPAPDVLRVLPWREELLRGLLGADLIGFHTEVYAANFRAAVKELDPSLRPVVGAFPMGVDMPALEALAHTPLAMECLLNLKASLGGQHLFLGVDRLDYTKGIRRRLMAFERLLARRTDLHGRLRLIQLAVPSRDNIPDYARLRASVERLVGRVNGTFGTVEWTPIRYVYRAVTPEELSALYQGADVMLVTPTRDGMNLVAKEYCAARVDGGGTLVLSELAGAAQELKEALLVNPYDGEEMSLAFERALALPEGERRWRMKALRKRVADNPVKAWAQGFLDELAAASKPEAGEVTRPSVPISTAAPLEPARVDPVAPIDVSPPDEVKGLERRLVNAHARLLVLDYDGTLVPIVRSPELAVPSIEVRETLRALSNLPFTQVHVVSGRPRLWLEEWLGDLPIGLHGEHGFWSRFEPHAPWVARSESLPGFLAPARKVMKEAAAELPGSELEQKSASLTFHYRRAEPQAAKAALAALVPKLQPFLGEAGGADLLYGKQVLELRARGIHKGVVLEALLPRLPKGALILAAGDDATDEDLFRDVPAEGLTVHVGETPSIARYRLGSPRALLNLLAALLAAHDAEQRAPIT
jgi:trehalose 6-phosphate synthase/phosphatase